MIEVIKNIFTHIFNAGYSMFYFASDFVHTFRDIIEDFCEAIGFDSDSVWDGDGGDGGGD